MSRRGSRRYATKFHTWDKGSKAPPSTGGYNPANDWPSDLGEWIVLIVTVLIMLPFVLAFG